jgi:TPR repeat protein
MTNPIRFLAMRATLIGALAALAACASGGPAPTRDAEKLAERAMSLGDPAPLYDFYRGVSIGSISSATVSVADALRRLGDFHAQGVAVAKDYGAAAKWYAEAAERGRQVRINVARDDNDTHANWNNYLRARLLETGGFGLGANPTEAASLYRLCAEALFAPCQDRLGDLYAEGTGVPKDEAQALEWWRLAAAEMFAGQPTPLAVRAGEKLAAKRPPGARR